MDNLPKLPGLDFTNRLKQNHTLSHCFDFRNGFRMPRRPPIGIGGEPLSEDSIANCSAGVGGNDSALYDPCLTYGRVERPPVEPFRPHFVRYDRIALTFRGFFKQAVPESRSEHYRIRHVNVMYFMEDDTITVYEPPVRDCGFPQGRLVRRGKVLRTEAAYYTWKDLNIGVDLQLNGHVYHLCDCDEFTREFLTAQGIELGAAEALPVDPVQIERQLAVTALTRQTPSDDDKLRRYLEFQGKVLTFDAWLQTSDGGADGACEPDGMTYTVYYFLEDDTIAVKELKENQEGRDKFPLLLKRMRVPIDWKRRPITFPAVYMETGEEEVTEYYQPKHMRVGETIFVFARRLLLLDCDAFTRKYFAEVLGQPQGNRREIVRRKREPRVRAIPEYLGLGSPEDSMQSVYSLQPKPPYRDLVKYMTNAGLYLRFGARLDTAHPEDRCREFVVFMSLADGKMKINEPPIRNSGIRGGLFMSARYVELPGTNRDQPEYYGPKHMRLGATLIVKAHRFVLHSGDLFALRYMQENPELFDAEAVQELRAWCLENGDLAQETREALRRECAEWRARRDEKPAEPSADEMNMEACLQSFNTAATDNIIQQEAPFVDRERLDCVAGAEADCDCQYLVDKGDLDVIAREKAAAELQRQIDATSPHYYVSRQCENAGLGGKVAAEAKAGGERKSVTFDECTKCS